MKHPQIIEADIFALNGLPVIPTNLGGIHGAGLAQLAATKGWLQHGVGDFAQTEFCVRLPVKYRWYQQTDMELLKASLRKLWVLAKSKPFQTYLLPLVGLGHGEGSPEEIVPLLAKMLRLPNLRLVLPGEGVNLGRPGTVRQDRSRELMPLIKELLAAELG